MRLTIDEDHTIGKVQIERLAAAADGCDLRVGLLSCSGRGRVVGCRGTYQNFDIRLFLKVADCGLLLIFGQVAKVIQEPDALLVQHSANDAGQFGPVEKD